MTLAQDLTSVWESVRPVIEDAFFADAYTVTRDTVSSDGRGGQTLTPATVETGLCTLVTGGSIAQGREYVSGPGVVASAPYFADMPWATTIRETDRITINGRTFNVISVKREGDWGVSVQAGLEERKP